MVFATVNVSNAMAEFAPARALARSGCFIATAPSGVRGGGRRAHGRRDGTRLTPARAGGGRKPSVSVARPWVPLVTTLRWRALVQRPIVGAVPILPPGPSILRPASATPAA